MTDRLDTLTPELSATERNLFFGCRSPEERNDLADMFEAANQEQKQTLYGVLREWMQSAVPTIGAN